MGGKKMDSNHDVNWARCQNRRIGFLKKEKPPCKIF